MAVFFALAGDLTIDHFALAVATTELFFLGSQTSLPCETGAWLGLCADLELLEKFISCACNLQEHADAYL